MKKSMFLLAILAVGLSACGKKEEPQAVSAPETAPAAEMPAPEAVAVDGAAKFKASCVSCHGAKGEGMGNFPKVAGLTADVFKSRMADYKAGKPVGPQSGVMMPIASQLSDAEVEALATHIASLQ